jgi:hypothetical protein
METESLRSELENVRDELMKRHQALGVGIGYKYKNGKRTNQIAIIFYVYRKRPLKQLQKLKIEPVPEKLFDYPTDVREVPEGFKIRSERNVLLSGRHKGIKAFGNLPVTRVATLGEVASVQTTILF